MLSGNWGSHREILESDEDQVSSERLSKGSPGNTEQINIAGATFALIVMLRTYQDEEVKVPQSLIRSGHFFSVNALYLLLHSAFLGGSPYSMTAQPVTFFP